MILHAGPISAGVGGVRFHQHLALLHRIAILDQHALDDAGLQQLQGLGALAHHDAALSDGGDVDLAEDGPGGAQNGAVASQQFVRRVAQRDWASGVCHGISF
jgi:hypothetical protein